MDYFVNYIIEAGLSLGIFTFVYWFMLRRETQFKATRFYLLFALLFSTLLPFISIKLNSFGTAPALQPGVEMGQTNLLESVTIYASGVPQRIGNVLLSFDYTMLIYILGAFVVFCVMLVAVYQIFSVVSVSRVFRLKNIRLVVLKGEISPYSFFNFIFISDALTKQEEWKSMVHHELEHVRQGHSFDVLFVDIMMIFQWFNPFYWMIRRMVRENHEFLADKGVLKLGNITATHYKKLLLSQAIGGSPVMTSNFFSIKTIKKRFKMITNNKSMKYTAARYTIGVVMALILTVMFACEKHEVENEILSENIIYKGNLLSQNEFEMLDISYVKASNIDRLDAILIYPEMKDDLTADTYSIVIEKNDTESFKLLKKLDLVELTISMNGASNPLDFFPDTKGETIGASDDEVFVVVEDMPEYPGGEEALRTYLAENTDYPQLAIDKRIEGKVYVTFVVGSNGKVRDARIARGVDSILDAEALRVVNSMPVWKPGKQKAQNVAVSYTVPIDFALK